MHLDMRDTGRDNISHPDTNPYRVFGNTDKKGTASAYEELGMMEKTQPQHRPQHRPQPRRFPPRRFPLTEDDYLIDYNVYY